VVLSFEAATWFFRQGPNFAVIMIMTRRVQIAGVTNTFGFNNWSRYGTGNKRRTIRLSKLEKWQSSCEDTKRSFAGRQSIKYRPYRFPTLDLCHTLYVIFRTWQSESRARAHTTRAQDSPSSMPTRLVDKYRAPAVRALHAMQHLVMRRPLK
jgi:hypothetical protein